ncbi:MAG: RimK family alpha-L-glutamate ligase [Lachnospiraceae bacterium]|nr:RimK family alpha-L-glutamate ligase [Lachnospiraceae bacterium]
MLTGYIIEKYSRMTGAYTCNRLVKEALKRGVDLRIIGIADVVVREEGVYHKAERLAPCDFVINRYKYGHIKDEIGALARRTYNDTAAFSIYINKYLQVKHLKSEGFLMPKYMLGTGFNDYQAIIDKLGEPFVVKGLESSQGAEVFLIENVCDFQALKEKYAPEKEYLFEEYVSESYGRDIRFYSVRGEVIACMTREAVEGFKANVALGAGVREYPIDDDIRQAAKDIYEQTGLDFLGIDLLFGKDKPYFCEINVMPGIEGMERATGVNVAGAIMDTIIGDFKDDH